MPGDARQVLDWLKSPLELKRIRLPNRFVRSATFEGMCDAGADPAPELAGLYARLARGGTGTIITGFAFVSRRGRAMHPGQCGIECDARVEAWRRITEEARHGGRDVRLIMQIAHAGRQTRSTVTGMEAVGPSSKPSPYFRNPVRAMEAGEIEGAIAEFASSARRARDAGFDGVQIHAAHGYLIHQFLSGHTNHRGDRWGEPNLFLSEVVRAVLKECGDGFALLVKLSGADDNRHGVRPEQTVATARMLDGLGVDAIEISYGTMDKALNIFRGGAPVDAVLDVNPLFRGVPGFLRPLWKRLVAPLYTRSLFPMSPNYNLESAAAVARAVATPVFTIGGTRTLDDMAECMSRGMQAVSMSRPLVADPAFARRLLDGKTTASRCTNCNLCAIYCDGTEGLKCRANEGT